MKLTTALILTLALTSCGQISRILDGTEKLPSQIQETNNGMAKTNEAIRLQKIGVALGLMQDPKNRKTLTPLPSDMMAAGKIMAEALTSEEALLFVKNYLVKVNKEQFEDANPLVQPDDPQIETLKFNFMMNKVADISMMEVVAGYLPDATIDEMIKTESDQGAYRDILFQILKMRANFYNDLMVHAAILSNDKLETLGKIEKVIEYNEKVEFICKLDFADQIALKITGLDADSNANASKVLNKDVALDNWKEIQIKAKDEFKAQSFSNDPKQNEAALKTYSDKYKVDLDIIQKKIDAYSKAP